ncbi:hypothetical protein LNQ82_02915 [Conchiformibius steedae DSM 2580]|uniref:Uncharacterized protein n=1 Tax=Conchiformibius steedae DSM 2580 TaxID=1121352 RepID=A0AAE9HXE7_9NEIS|nr:hypothetical protein [Conchiformibius steedae]QMT33475.1 hypothetical protein H3L98_10440 [Conchiformibius steedae]URD68132.1 hypothetical protein LNQ82_02915 [Conchiformibius steedae DSM 2580]
MFNDEEYRIERERLRAESEKLDKQVAWLIKHRYKIWLLYAVGGVSLLWWAFSL